MNIDLVYSLLSFYKTQASNSNLPTLVIVPFKYPDECLLELIVESYIDTQVEDLYKLIFDSIVDRFSLIDRFVKLYGPLCDLYDARVLIDECNNIRRSLVSIIKDSRLEEYTDTMKLLRSDDQSVSIVLKGLEYENTQPPEDCSGLT